MTLPHSETGLNYRHIRPSTNCVYPRGAMTLARPGVNLLNARLRGSRKLLGSKLESSVAASNPALDRKEDYRC